MNALCNARQGPAGIRGRWSPMATAVIALVLIFTLGTIVVGVELFEITGQHTQFSTQ